MNKKIYKCRICHVALETMPIRLVKQVGDNKESYRRFYNEKNFDFCEKCYGIFKRWIKKHSEVSDNE